MVRWALEDSAAATSDPAGWPFAVQRHEDGWIPLADGHRLSCSLWLPATIATAGTASLPAPSHLSDPLPHRTRGVEESRQHTAVWRWPGPAGRWRRGGWGGTGSARVPPVPVGGLDVLP